MPIRKAEAVWHGDLKEGHGHMQFGGGEFELDYSVGSRFEEDPGGNPEQLLGAAHAGCFSMALASGLSKAGFPPKAIHTTAEVHLEKTEAGWTVTRIQLNAEAEVPGIKEADFLELAQKAKTNCPISRALGSVEIELEARLVA
ncbi:MAG: OsmC family protein [Anaerolineales bacterium]